MRDRSYRCVVLGVTHNGAVANNWMVGFILQTCTHVNSCEAKTTIDCTADDWIILLMTVSETKHALTPLWCVRFMPRNPSEMPLVPVVPPVPVPVPVMPVLVPVPVPVPEPVPVP